MGDLSSQDSIRRAMVAERQTLQDQRDNMQAAYEAGSIDTDNDDTHWGSLAPGELLGLKDTDNNDTHWHPWSKQTDRLIGLRGYSLLDKF